MAENSPAPDAAISESELHEMLAAAGIAPALFLGRYELSHRVEERLAPFNAAAGVVEFAGAQFATGMTIRPGRAAGSFFLRIKFALPHGSPYPISAGLHLRLNRWSRENYVLMPAAVYAGNRFEVAPSHSIDYCDNKGPAMPITITNVPRLEIGAGPSRIQLLTGDFSTPAIGFRDVSSGRGFFLQTTQGNQLGNHSLSLEENAERTAATIVLKSPGIRENVRYEGRVSTDRGAVLNPGDVLEVECALYFFDAPRVQALFDQFFAIRNDFRGAARTHHEIPFSSCWEIQQAKYNRQNWVEEHGYYSVGMREVASQDWQTGWVGGTNPLYALLLEGTVETRRRAERVFDFLWRGGVGKSGFYLPGFYSGEWRSGRYTLTRYHADSIYFIVRSYMLLREREPARELPEHWGQLVRVCADAVCNLWERHGQLGHRVDAETGEIMMGETACAGLAPGALALCAHYFDEQRYLVVAEEAAERYHTKFVAAGITNGGPGDIIQNIDSESAFGLLEGFIALYEITGQQRYIHWARDVAHQCASWVVTYDFRFPAASTFGKLDMLTTGTVFANVQNKHSAPGICTLSGCSLLKLFRATGDTRYLDLVREIAHAIPQYMSRADRPITDRRPGQTWPVMDPGWINERVNMSDWEVRCDPNNEIGVGEIFGGSTWSEVAMMLTYAELPGIYAQPDTGLIAVLDHVEATLDASRSRLTITNPTQFHASVKLFVEHSEQMSTPLGPLAFHDCPRVEIAPGATVHHELKLTAPRRESRVIR